MAYWLLKTEPDAYSWDDQVKKGAKGDAWTGVRNFAARKNLQAMKKGDRAFFYHTGDEKQVVGIVEIIKEAYKDPTDEKGVFYAVDTKAIEPVPEARDTCGDQGRAEAQEHGAGARAAPLGAGGDRRGVEAGVPDGWGEGVISPPSSRKPRSGYPGPSKHRSSRKRAVSVYWVPRLRGA